MKILRTFGIIVISVLLLISALVFFAFQSSKPRDLGITYTQENQNRAYTKNGVISAPLPQANSIEQSIRYEGKKDVSFTMTNAEITALINNETWKYMPVSNVQIRINPDGTGEASGILHVDRILPYISLSHSTEEVQKAMADFHIGGTPAFYLKGKVAVADNQVTLNPDRIEIGRIAIPGSLVSQNLQATSDFAEKRIQAVPNLFVKSLTLSNGSVSFSGTMPEKEYKSE